MANRPVLTARASRARPRPGTADRRPAGRRAGPSEDRDQRDIQGEVHGDVLGDVPGDMLGDGRDDPRDDRLGDRRRHPFDATAPATADAPAAATPGAGAVLPRYLAPAGPATATQAPVVPPALPMPPAFADAPRGAAPAPPAAAPEALAAPGAQRVQAAAADAQARSAAEPVPGAAPGEAADAGDRDAARAGRPPAAASGVAAADEAEAAPEPSVAMAEPADAGTADDPADLGLRPLRAPSIDAPWPVPSDLPSDALAFAPAAGAARPARQNAPGSGAAQPNPPPTPQGSAPAPATATAPHETAAARDAERHARDAAQRAYLALARAARQGQLGFVARAAGTADDLVRAHDGTGRALARRHDADLWAVDAAAERACTEVSAQADVAVLRLDTAAANATRAIEAAGRRARAAIDAGERRAAGQIEATVGDLVAGHARAYDGVITAAQKDLRNALEQLSAWRDARTTHYPLAVPDPLDAAKNESLQTRIPRWVDPEKTRLEDRFQAKKTAWTGSRDSTVCTLSCTYRDGLQRENARMARESRQAVARSLAQARRTLQRQHRDGRQSLAEQRRVALQQVAVQQRATQGRLAGQARGLVGAVRRESQSALAGVTGSARAALPTWWRQAAGFAQALRRSALQGPPAVRHLAERGPSAIAAGLQTSTRALDARLADSQRRLHDALGQRDQTHRAAGADAHARFEAALAQLGRQAGQRLSDGVDGLVSAFGGLDDSVQQAAQGWSQPLSRHLAGFIRSQSDDARRQLRTLVDGGQPGGAGGAGAQAGAGPAAAAPSEAPQPDCSGCQTAAAEGQAAGGAAAAPAAAGAEAAAPGLRDQGKEETAFFALRAAPKTFFQTQLAESGGQLDTLLRQRAERVKAAFEGAFAGTVNEAGVLAALRGLTVLKGRALEQVMYPRVVPGHSMDVDLRWYLDHGSGDYNAARAYLEGRHLDAARYELRDSIGFFNDDEGRIEAVMRALSPDDLRVLGGDASLRRDVGDALGGTDRQVFDALLAGDHALADAYRLRDQVNTERRAGRSVAAAIERYTGAPEEGDWRADQELDADSRRRAVVAALGGIVSDADVAAGAGAGGVRAMSAEDRAVAYVTRDIEVMVGGGAEMPPETVTMRLEGANRDLAVSLLRSGGNSIETRVARLGVELQRAGGRPDPVQLDRALYDDRFMPDRSDARPEEREQNETARRAARTDRARTLLLAAQRYTRPPGAEGPPLDTAAVMRPDYQPDQAQVRDARGALVTRLRERYGSDTVGAELAEGLLTDERPSAATVALAMRHATLERSGTNEDLLFRFTERMTRSEIADMRVAFRKQTGQELDAVLGTFEGGDLLPELSGDDRLRMERALRGVARTDQERLEAAAFTLLQQRRETGPLGASLAEGTLADTSMRGYERELRLLAGGPIAFNRRGELISRLPNFDPQGRFTGSDRDSFAGVVNTAQQVAESYSRRVDAFADVLTTGIAILGAIAAAVITVVTGGAALPLIAAAVATGLASMAANYAIKGGRYGWEQAAIDLGMTAVQAITAGVGAQLGAAAQVASKGAQAAQQVSRTVTLLSRLFTENPLINQIIVGAITGSISGLGTAALNEQTWEQGNPVANLFLGLAKGALSGAGTAAVTNSIEGLSIRGQALSARLQGLAAQGGLLRGGGAVLLRGGARALIAGTGGMAGRSADILVDAAAGRFHGDPGDALREIGKAGLHSAIQGFGEGAGEAGGQRLRNQRVAAASHAINAERQRAGLAPLAGSALHGAAEDLLLLDIISRQRGPAARARNLAHVATQGGLRPAAPAAARPARPAAGGEEGPAARPGARAGTDEAAEAPHALRAPAPQPAETAPALPARPADTGAEAAAMPRAAPAPEAAEAAGAPPPAKPAAVDEASFGTPEFDAIVRDLGASGFGQHLAAGAQRPLPTPQVDTTRTRAQVDALAHARARRMAVPGQAPGTQIQHNTKTLDVTRNLPPGMAPLHADVINRNLMHLQSRKNLPATLLHVDPHGGGTRYHVDDVPRGRIGDAGARGEQLDLFLPPGPARKPDFHTEHKFVDNVLIPALADQIVQARQRAGEPPLDPRLLAIVAGEQARLVMSGALPPSAQSGMIEVLPMRATVAPPAGPRVHAADGGVEDSAGRPAPPRQLELDFGPTPARAAATAAAAAPAAAEGGAPSAGPRAAEGAAPSAAPRVPAVPETEGAAARIGASAEMQLAPRPTLAPEQAHPVARSAVEAVLDLPGLAGQATLHPAVPGQPPVVTLRRADGQTVQVRIVVGSTEGGDIASFRRGGGAGEEGVQFVVTLSDRARPGARARAIAHELAELRHHGAADLPRADALAAGRGLHPASRLSPHDHGRLAELALLARRVEAPDAPEATRSAARREAEALLGHLGLLHAEDQVPRVKLATEALPSDTPARRLLDETRRQALRSGADDLLAPAHPAGPHQPLTAGDQARIGQLAELAAALQPPASGRVHEVDPSRPSALRQLEDQLARMGLLGTGAAVRQRIARVKAVLGDDAPAARQIDAVRARLADPSHEDALRPGLAPDARTVLSRRDRRRLARLGDLLDALDAAQGGQPRGQRHEESAALSRLRHQAESLAAEMGLVFGGQAGARTALAQRHLQGGERRVQRLAEVLAGGHDENPRLLPLTGTPDDLPVLMRQVAAARAAGQVHEAARRMEMARLHLEAVGALGAAPLDPALASRLAGLAPDAAAVLTDLRQRRAHHDQAQRLSDEAAAAARQLAAVLARRSPQAARQAQIDALQARVQALTADAAAARRMATRPPGMTEDAARDFKGAEHAFPALPALKQLPLMSTDRRNAALVRQLHGDAPDFQPLARFMALYREAHQSISFVDVGPGRTDRGVDAATYKAALRNEDLAAEWARGRFISGDTHEPTNLPLRETVRAETGAPIEVLDASGAPARLGGAAAVDVADRSVPGAKATTPMTAAQAVAARQAGLAEAQRLRTTPPVDTVALKAVEQRVRDLSEALGEAAGRQFAEGLPGGAAGLVSNRGAGVTDLLHIDPATGHVTVIECKGGKSPLGLRSAQRGGRRVDAEQTTPEYLRSLADAMIRHDHAAEGAAILAALDQGPPHIRVLVVRQDFDAATGQLLPIDATDYPVPRKGL